MKLDEVSKLFGFPGKFGIDGSQIAALYEAGEIKRIRDYCETDVLIGNQLKSRRSILSRR